MTGRLPVIGLMLGDMTGIGPEISAKLLADDKYKSGVRVVVIGDARVLELGCRDAGVELEWQTAPAVAAIDWAQERVPLVDLGNIDPARIRRGEVSPESGRLAGETLEHMIGLALDGGLDGICFAPLNKAALNRGGWKYADEHQMFAALTRHSGFFGEMNVIEEFSTFRVTSHVALREAVDMITPERIAAAIELADATLRATGIARPAIAAALLAAAAQAAAQEYPAKPVRMIVGFAAGGGTDTTARPIAHKLSELFGQQVIVDNRPGAAGNIATDLVAKASPDGYTILMGTIAALAINPSLYQNLPFDPERDLAPVTQAVDSTNILSLHPSVPANSVKELIALARSKSLNYGSSGVGATGHLAGELFNLMTGVKLVHVPYKGGAPAMVDLVAGRVELVFATAASAVPQIKGGKIKGIAVTTAKRSTLMPELPTIAEAGLPGYDANNWYGLMVPANTPRAIIDRLNAETVKVLNMPEVKTLLFNQGSEAAPSTPEEFGAYIRSERAKWAKIVKASGAKVE